MFRISAILFFAVVLPVSVASAQDNMQAGPDEVTARSDSALVHSYLEEAGVSKGEGDIRRQRKLLGRAYEAADSLDVSLLLKAVEKDLGEYYLETSSYDSAETVLRRAAERSSDGIIQTRTLNLLATAYRYQSKYPEAMKTYNQGLALVDSLESPKVYAAIKTNKASIYENLGNLSKAVSLYQDGITFAEIVEDSSFLATALNNLGNLYFQKGDYEEAIPYLEESIAISEQQGFYNTLLRSKHNLASAHRDLGNYKKSREVYEEAWALQKKVRPDIPPIQLLHSMGVFYLKVSELKKAEEHFQESLEYARQAGVPAGLFHNLIGLGDVSVARSDYTEATDFYSNAFDVGQKVDVPPFRVTAADKLYKSYKKANNFDKALKYHELVKQVSDSLTEAQQDEQLALAETELGLRQQQKINQLLQERQDEQEARIQTQNWLIIAFTVVLIIVIISLYLLYRSNKERERINKELEELNEVKNKMMGIIAHDLRSPMSSMQGVFYLLKNEDLELEEIREIASELEISIRENINMMDNLLNWANSQMTGLKIDIEKVSAFEAVDEVIENLSFSASHKSITLVNEVDTTIEAEADINLLQLIIRNLVSNAIKFSNEGDSVTITAKEQNDEVIFKVEDTGIGIPEEEREGLFSLQGNSRSGTNNENGSGLGLKLCKEFVEKQNGTIELESTVGEGSTFYVSLPKAS